MTVAELIKALAAVEDQSLMVCRADAEEGAVEVTGSRVRREVHPIMLEALGLKAGEGYLELS
jgi:hypothetical protein